MTNRLYPYTDALMLAAGKVIVANLRRHTKELSEVRSVWNRSYSTQFDKRIDLALSEVLNFDAASVSRYVKFDMYESIQQVVKNLNLLRIQLEYDIRDDQEKLEGYLSILGFTKYQGPIASLNEDDIIELLSCFVANSSECIKKEINKLGVSRELLDKLMKSCVELSEMRKIQEELLDERRDIPEEGVAALNDIYEELVSICSIARAYFVDISKKQRMFHFPEIVFRLEGRRPESFKSV